MEVRVRNGFLVVCCVLGAGCLQPRTTTDPNDLEPYDELPDAAMTTSSHDAGARDAAMPTLTDAAVPGHDAGPSPSDVDGDGLDDAWEASFNLPSVLDPHRRDTDGDGTDDGDEDPDEDGLTNAQEASVSTVPHWPSDSRLSPVRADLIVELDCMHGRCLDEEIVRNAAAAYLATPFSRFPQHPGIGLHVFLDETELPEEQFDGTFEQRHAFFAEHGPTALPGDFPSSQLVHVAVVTLRQDLMARGGELVTDGEDITENTGVLIFHEALDAIHPACGVPNDPVRTEITLADALTATFIHELGHALQLGHDTEVGGGINIFNIMSVPAGCAEAQQRFHGFGNDDVSKGATQSVHAPRFSHAAAQLMDFRHRVSVDTGLLDPESGNEM